MLLKAFIVIFEQRKLKIYSEADVVTIIKDFFDYNWEGK